MKKRGHHRQKAFTLIEVMIAMAILFIAVFAILGLISTTLRNARRLQESRVGGGLPMAQIYLNPMLEAGETNGDFGELYPGYLWRASFDPVQSNGLVHVEVDISRPDGTTDRDLDTLMWIPNFKQPMATLP